jgi:DNA (cytosine-5)-methyltransferase 1
MKRPNSFTKKSYLELIQQELQLPKHKKAAPFVVNLFAGCGGLSLGFEAVGFRTIGYEMLADACASYQNNLKGYCHHVTLKQEFEWVEKPEIIIGGPPCQPFSVGGHQQGLKDSRDGFPIFLSAVKYGRPQIALFENVRGMLYRNKEYFEEILTALRNLGYIVEWEVLTASDYGVPQRRQRLFCVAHKGGWNWPEKTYLHSPYTAGEALEELVYMIPNNARFLTSSMDEYIERYEKASKCVRPRDLHLDQPARTVTCRNLSGATGDMLRIRLPDGRRRRLTVQEGARLQSFPDWFKFQGSEESQFNQIGNAVPPILAKALASSVKNYLENHNSTTPPNHQLLNQPIQLSLNLF